MSDLGQLLKKARSERGLSLDQLQETTKIRKRYLEAIEEGNYKILPGNFYVRAFIKSYSETVGLDPEEVLRLYQNVIPAASPEQTIEPIRRKRRNNGSAEKFSKWSTTLLMWFFPIMIVGIIWYYFYSTYEGNDPVSDPPPITDQVNDSSDMSEPDAAEPEPQPEPTPEPEPEPVPILTLTGTTAAEDTYSLDKIAEMTVVIELANGGCWIEVREDNKSGKVLTSKVYNKGESLSYELARSVWIRMGAPANVQLTVNGTPISTAGLKNPKNVQVNMGMTP